MTMQTLEDVVTSGHKFPKEIRSALLKYDEVEKEIVKYKYRKLPAGKKRIRLLRLSPGVLNNPQVVCEMIEAEFDEHNNLRMIEKNHTNGHTKKAARQGTNDSRAQAGDKAEEETDGELNEEDIVHYNALSWRWVDEDNSEYTIMIRKSGATYKEKLYKKKVSKTLGLALKYLRLPAEDRMIWIDAICINQADGEERSFQVSMMSLVYTNAEEVCVWLGEDDNESTRAITFIENEVSKLKNFDDLCKDRKHAEDWGSLLVLMQRDWFSRRWVVQEITLARKATVYCGPDKIKWRDLAIAVELFVEVETATHRLSELMKKHDKFALVPYWFEHISELGASLLVNATARIFRDYQRDENGTLQESNQAVTRRSLLSLEYLVTSLSIFDCGRPHDSIYALIAIARDAAPHPPTSITEQTQDGIITSVFADQLEQKPYPLDYTSPYPDVCKEFIHFCIERAAKADPLQALDILCRPWAKEWRPEHQKPDAKMVDSEKSTTEASPVKKIMIKHEGPWMITVDTNNPLREPHSLSTSGSNPLFFWLKSNTALAFSRNPELITSRIPADPKYGKREDQRSCKEYFRDEQGLREIRPFVKRWFSKPGVEVTLNEAHKRLDSEAKRGTKKERARRKGKQKEENEVYMGDLCLPSWVAMITGAPFDIFLHPGMDMVKMGRKNADPLVGVPQDGHRNYSAGQSNGVDMKSLKFRRRTRLGHYSLYVKGFCIDRVAKVAQISQGGAIPATWLDMAGWSKARDHGSFDNDPGDPPDAFWRTLVADRGRYDRNPPYYYARACKETIMKGGLRSNAVNTAELIYNERNSIIAEFCRRVQAVIWNRALIRTEKNLLGLVSENVKVGDRICIIYGCTVPVILRKGKRKRPGERQDEIHEDFVETMKKLMVKCEKARVWKAQYREGSDKWIEILRKRKVQDKEPTQENWKKEVREDLDLWNTKRGEKKLMDIAEAFTKATDKDDADDTNSRVKKFYNGLEKWIREAEVGGKNGKETTTDRINFSNEAYSRSDVHKDSMQASTPQIKEESQSSESNISDTDREGIEEAHLQGSKSGTAEAEYSGGDVHVKIQKSSGVEEVAGDIGSSQPALDKHGSEKEGKGNIPEHISEDELFGSDDDLEEDYSDEEEEDGNADSSAKEEKPSKQESANKNDPFRHYKFLGEAYIHGMMDGEAVRDKFYSLKPDHIFELR